jgi:hypothetical protein
MDIARDKEVVLSLCVFVRRFSLRLLSDGTSNGEYLSLLDLWLPRRTA